MAGHPGDERRAPGQDRRGADGATEEAAASSLQAVSSFAPDACKAAITRLAAVSCPGVYPDGAVPFR
jgi:hypothetical protein